MVDQAIGTNTLIVENDLLYVIPSVGNTARNLYYVGNVVNVWLVRCSVTTNYNSLHINHLPDCGDDIRRIS